MRWDAYYIRAAISLQLGRPHQQVMDDFSRARALEPNTPTFCMQEAALWLDHAPLQALPALREAIRRDPRNAADYYRQIADNIHRFPDLREPLRSMAEDPKLRLLYLERVSGSDFQTAAGAARQPSQSRQLHTIRSCPSLSFGTAGVTRISSSVNFRTIPTGAPADGSCWADTGWRREVSRRL